MKQYIGISRDHSRSMWTIARAAARDYNSTIQSIQEAARIANLDTIVSVVKCGVGWQATVERETVNSNVSVLRPLLEHQYVADGSRTPLWDSVGELIEMLSAVPDADDPKVSFLVMVITDGANNSSTRWSAQRLADKIRELQASDRWTFVFRVPRGHTSTLVGFGIPEGNILEWDQTERGVEEASVITRSAMTSYYTERSKGVTSTAKFFADLSNVSKKDVQRNLQDISSQVSLHFVPPEKHGIAIKEFIEQHTSYRLGAAYYQLTKTEKVQEHKTICLRDRATKAVYSGVAARDLLGLPHYGSITLAPHKLDKYDVFVQSTSVNRKLVGGTSVLYWPSAR